MSNQRKIQWQKVRTGVTGAGDTALADGTKTWASIQTNHSSNLYRADNLDTRVDFRFRFSNAGATVNYTLYALRPEGDAQFACSGVATGGNMQVNATYQISSATTYYADKITVVNDSAWPTGVISTSEDDTVDDEMANGSLKTLGRRFFLIILDTVSAGTVEVDMAAYDE